jgi:protocatechuate 3,4-dioxygenase beta subunit
MDRMTRRRALGLAGSAGAALLVARTGLPAGLATEDADAAAAVIVTPEMTEGPYWIDELLRRSDVRANTATAKTSASAVQAGVPLALTIKVLDADTGGAVNGAHVDIWHANANGLYSDEAQNGTQGQNFLRGYQVTGVDAGLATSPSAGQVGFKTIWPGWYSGRAIHIHVRVRTYDSSGALASNYTTQIFFSDKDNDTVLTAAAPYSSRSPQTDPMTDESDNILGSATATNVVPVTGSVANGFAATFTVALSGSSLGSAATSADASVSASLVSARVVRATNGNRSAVFSLRAGEQLTASAKLLRGATTLGRATGQLTAGVHQLRVGIGAGVASGAATLQVVLTDAAGNQKVLRRSLHVPA